ncbi:MAG: peroxiredoxin, partial [Hyphomicrobiales bacterium]|nr:peroxiredoxin [Hyphomicrobiales bacterium]
MTIKSGDRMPEGSFGVMGEEGPTQISSDELFSGKKVVLFGLPGAFTPTCHRNHLPGFLENIDVIKEKGIDAVACISVNDVFVMHAWGKSVGANGKILMLADGNAAYTKAI